MMAELSAHYNAQLNIAQDFGSLVTTQQLFFHSNAVHLSSLLPTYIVLVKSDTMTKQLNSRDYMAI